MPLTKKNAAEMLRLAESVDTKKKANADAAKRADDAKWQRQIAATQRREAKIRRKATRDPRAKALYEKVTALIEKAAKSGKKSLNLQVFGKVLEMPADFSRWRSMEREDFMREQDPARYAVDAVAKRLRRDGYDVCFTRHWRGQECANPYNDGTGHVPDMQDASCDLEAQSIFGRFREPNNDGTLARETETYLRVRWGKAADKDD